MLMVPDALISSRVRYTTLLPDAALPDAALPEAAVEEEPPHAVRTAAADTAPRPSRKERREILDCFMIGYSFTITFGAFFI